jgi:hypothetical protein
VYDLLTAAVKKGLVKPKTYAHLKPALLRETAWHLSELQVEEEERRSSKKNGNNYSHYDYYGYEGGNSEAIIERNFNLLAPFFKKDKEVQALVDRAVRYGDKNTQLLAYGFYLKNGISVAPEKLKPFSEDDKTRYMLFEQLAKLKQLKQYASWFSDTTALARSYVMEKGQNRGIDSIQFVSKHKTVLNNQSATLYFFDIKGEDDEEWGLASVIMPKDFSYLSKDENDDDDYIDPYTGYGRGPVVQIMPEITGKEKEEHIRKKIGSIRFANRERYVSDDMQERYYYEGY